MRPGTESEPEIDCSESFLGRGLMMRSEGLPRKEAAVMLMSFWVAIMRSARWAELVGEKGSGCSSARLADPGFERREGCDLRWGPNYYLWRGKAEQGSDKPQAKNCTQR
jgi:hypothetical protein